MGARMVVVPDADALPPPAQRWSGKLLRLVTDTHLSLPLFTLLLLTAIWGSTIRIIEAERVSAANAMRDAVHELMDTYEAQVARNIGAIDQTLKVAAYAVSLKGALGALPELKRQDLLPPSLVFTVQIADRGGRVIASSPAAPARSIAGQDYFTSQVARAGETTYVSVPLADQPGGTPVLHFTRRLQDDAGNFDGVVMVQVDPGYFTSSYEKTRQGERGLLAIFGADNQPRALRVGAREGWQGVAPSLERFRAQPAWDGVDRETIVQPSLGGRLTVVVGLARDEQMAPFLQNRKTNILLASIASAVLLLFAGMGWAWSWQRTKEQRLMRRAQETYAAAAEANLDAFFMLHSLRDGDGVVINFQIAAANSRAAAMTGLSKQQLQGMSLSEVLPNSHSNGLFDKLRQAADNRAVYQEEWENDHEGARARWVHLQVVGVEDGVVAIVRDITERKQTETQMLTMALHDALTGLPNRSLITQRLELAVGDARRDGSAVLVCFIDLDGFKLVNDGLGHQAGDELLKITASRMQACVRQQDTVGRLGGDEFVLILPWSMEDMSAARGLLDTILAAVTQPLTLAGQEVQISCSIGVSLFPRDGDSADKLLVNADAAMYRAKSSGKNNYQFFDEEMNASGDQKLSLLEGLRHGIEQGQFRLLYQPKIDLHTNRIFGVEALVRWQHPQRGVISPMRFIPLAEESGLIVELGEWVLRQACLQNQAWRDAGLAPITIAVNVSPRQFDDRRLVERVTLALADSGLAPQGLELEVTESLTMRDIPQAVVKMEQLAAMGLSLSIDDFGTGFSSLASLKSYPLTRLKIDQSFVRDLDGRLQDQAIVRAVIAMAHQMQLRVIAEGVETAEQRDFLLENGCDEMQGYLYSHPVDAAAIAALLMAQRS